MRDPLAVQRAPWLGAILTLLVVTGERGQAAEPTIITVEAGRFERRDTPVRLEVPPDVGEAGSGPGGFWLREEGGRGGRLPAQIERHGDSCRVTFILAGTTPAGAARRFRIERGDPPQSPWTLPQRPDGAVELENRGRGVLRYNVSPRAQPDSPPTMVRGAYIHPAFSPSGALITGDFSKFHPHHRGFFLAYAKARWSGLELDFWNIQKGNAKVVCDHLGKVTAGPVTARFEAFHRWEAKDRGTVLNERWDVEAYDVPGLGCWLFDLTSTQQAVGSPFELLPYRYGGMAYRGPDPFQPAGVLDVLTSEGLNRQDADQKPARWVDLTGPIESGSDRYAGAMVADHPANPNHPTIARIHPTTLPFFSYVPSHDRLVTIDTDRPTVFRYRILIHDGHPNRERDERIWRDFAEPPVARVGGVVSP
jgi:hypothetical protein